MTADPTPASLRFGPDGRFQIQPLERRLLVDGEPAALGARAFDLLLALCAQPGRLLTKHQLIDAVWPGLVVEENNLATQISALRKVLGGDVIVTIPGRGYRFAARLEGAAAQSAEAASSQPALVPAEAKLKTNLPQSLPALLGRADDLAALGALIDQHALVSIVGAGGMGKTRLAQTLLGMRRRFYQHGVCWVDLAPITDPSQIAAAIAAGLGMTLGSGEPLAALCMAVTTLDMLVALDNAEHVLEGTAASAQALLASAPGVRLIVTSQAPLKLAPERVYRLESLEVPPHALPATQAAGFGAVALFAMRAAQADACWALTDDNAPAVIDVCRQLDGLPLAIELAAARVPLLGVKRLAASMQDRLRLLTASRDRMAPARQQTLRATLDWSHSLLDEPERMVFRRMAVFAGSTSLEMIQAVVADPEGELDAWMVLDMLVRLIDRSLVAVHLQDDQAAPRYRLLDSPRLFAMERLLEAGEAAELKRRHAHAVADRFQQAWPEPFDGGIGLEAWHETMVADLDNGRQAFQWACAAGNPPLALRIAATLLLALPKSAAREQVVLCEQCEPWLDANGVDAELRARVAWRMARSLQNVSLPRVRSVVEAALQALPESPQADTLRWLRYALLTVRCFVQAVLDEITSARATLSELRRLEDARWPAHRRLYGGQAAYMVATQAGDWPDAIAWLERTASWARGAGMSWTQLQAHLVDIQLASGDAAAAARTGAELLDAVADGRDQVVLVYARLNLSSALLALDETPQARAVLQAGWAQAAAFDCCACFADNLALLAALEGRPHAASLLAGYADQSKAAVGARQANEAKAIDLARGLARAVLSEPEFHRRYSEGLALRDADIARIAFSTEDSA